MNRITRWTTRTLAAALAAALVAAVAADEAAAQCTFPGVDLNLTDGEGFLWDVQKNGTIDNGTSDAYDVGQSLQVDGVYFPNAAYSTEMAGRQAVHGPATMSGLNVTRRVYVPSTEGWARFLEYFQNTGGSPITVTVRIENNVGSDGGTNVITTSSGDAVYTVADHWLITDDANGVGDPTLIHEFWGPAAALAPTQVGTSVYSCAGPQGAFAEFSLTVPAGSTRILMHFGAQNANQATAIAKAPAINALPPSTLAGIPPLDRPLIKNWNLFCGDGVIDAGETCDDGNLIDGDCCSSVCQFEGGNPGCSQAAPIVVPSASYAGPAGNLMVGWTFTPASNVTVTALGVADMPPSAFSPPTPSDGFLDSHQIGIWTLSQTLLVSTTMPIGSGTLLVDNFRYVPVPATVLTGGQTYVVAAHFPPHDGVNDDVVSNGAFTFDPRIAFVGGREQFGTSGFVFPTNTVPGARFGPSFLFHGICGDGGIDGGETCDDGNLTPNDGCDSSCQLECGNGTIQGAEQCDDGNTLNGDCCTSTCALVANGVPCRPAVGACDAVEVCDGASQLCPADAKLTGVCRPAVDVCDLSESCNGVADTCPADGVASAAVECRAVAGDCDVPDFCDGVGTACPADEVLDDSNVCRPAAGVCDVAENCSGSAASCPPDAKSSALCRAATDVCDAAESCDGLSDDCPLDALELATTVCRPAVDDCDVAENCTGVSSSCPADVLVPDGDGDTLCDAVDPCTNLGPITIDRPRIVVRGQLTPLGDDKLRFKGELVLPHPFSPALDPVARGARVVIADGVGATVTDTTIPPGAFNPGTRTGWKLNPAGNRWVYVNPNGVNGFVRLVIRDKSSTDPGLLRFVAVAKNGAFPAGNLPLRGTIVIDAPTAETGQCGEIAFPGPAPAPACELKASGDKVLCK